MKHTYTPVILGLLSALSNVSAVSEVTKKIRREQRITNAELHGNKLPQTTVVNCSPKKYAAHLFQTVDASKMIDRIFDGKLQAKNGRKSASQKNRVFGYEFDKLGAQAKSFAPGSHGQRGKYAIVNSLRTKNFYIEALHAAFMRHLPFQLRPDDIWILIEQGITQHIFHGDNAEKYRDRFVSFDGKKEIIVRDDNLNIQSNRNNWTYVLDQFALKSRDIVKADIVDTMTVNFTTTSKISSLASKVVLFKALSKYIDFTTMTMSGIPEVQVRGTVGDWAKIQEKLAVVRSWKLGRLSEWLDELDFIIASIKTTVAQGGTTDREHLHFWDSIYHYSSGSGGPTVTGWAGSLFPYVYNEYKGGMVWNEQLEWQKYHPFDSVSHYWGGITPKDFPASFSKAPMKWEYYNQEIECGMYGGIFGAVQNEADGMIVPVLGYLIGDDVEL